MGAVYTIPADGVSLSQANTWTADQTFNDDVKGTLGTGGDADIYYDGTDVVIDPQVVGSGILRVLAGLRLENPAGASNSKVLLRATNTQAISGSAVEIAVNGSGYGTLALITGRKTTDSTIKFMDMVLYGEGVTPTAIHSFSVRGSPAARTYSTDGTNLKLVMAADTYDVVVCEIMMGNPN